MCNLIDNLDKNSYIGSSIINNLNNLTSFAKNIFAKHDELRITEVTDEDIQSFVNAQLGREYQKGDKCKKVNKYAAIEIVSYDETGEVTRYLTVMQYYMEYVYKMFFCEDRKHYFSLQTLNANAKEFPDPDGYTDFEDDFMRGLDYTYMKAYAALFNLLFDSIMDELDDTSLLDEVYNLCKKFPVEYDYDDYDDVLVREVNIDDIPHIELEYKSFGKQKSVGFANLRFLSTYETTTVVVRFVNVDIKGYTPRFEVINNSYADTSAWVSRKLVDIAWGEWVEPDACELKITKNNSELGCVRIKVYVIENPEIVAYICGM
jgi:hypothetical protein